MQIDAAIVNYRLGAAVLRAVATLAEQDPAPRTTVVDNSEDPAEAAWLRENLPAGCRLLVSDTNVGFGAACNRVFAESTSEGFLLLNPDARLRPGALRGLASFLRDHPRAGAVSPTASLDDAGTFRLPELLLPRWWHALLLETPDEHSAALLGDAAAAWRAERWAGWFSGGAREVEGVPGGHALLRRSAVAAAGGLFDPGYFMYYEDTDLAARLAAAGHTSHVVPDACAVHEASSAPHADPHFKQRREHESADRYLARRFGTNWRLKAWRWSCRLRGSRPWRPEWPSVRAETAWAVPEAWQSGWVLEVGLNPFLLPACLVAGTGPEARVSEDVLRRFPADAAYARLGNARNSREHTPVHRWLRTPITP